MSLRNARSNDKDENMAILFVNSTEHKSKDKRVIPAINNHHINGRVETKILIFVFLACALVGDRGLNAWLYSHSGKITWWEVDSVRI